MEKSHGFVISSEFPGKSGQIPNIENMLNAAPPRAVGPYISDLTWFIHYNKQ
jgi:hypothetical protein